MYDVVVVLRVLLVWEIVLVFVIEVIVVDGVGWVDGRARLVGDELRFAGDKVKLLLGFVMMGVWVYIDV